MSGESPLCHRCQSLKNRARLRVEFGRLPRKITCYSAAELKRDVLAVCVDGEPLRYVIHADEAAGIVVTWNIDRRLPGPQTRRIVHRGKVTIQLRSDVELLAEVLTP